MTSAAMKTKFEKGDVVLIDNDYDVTFELGIVSNSGDLFTNVVTNETEWVFSMVQIPTKFVTLISKGEFK